MSLTSRNTATKLLKLEWYIRSRSHWAARLARVSIRLKLLRSMRKSRPLLVVLTLTASSLLVVSPAYTGDQAHRDLRLLASILSQGHKPCSALTSIGPCLNIGGQTQCLRLRHSSLMQWLWMRNL